MTDLPSFTIGDAAKIFDVPGIIISGELGAAALIGADVTFTSNIPEGEFVTWGGSLYHVPPVVAKVQADGTLRRNGDPVKLLANDAGLNADGIQWQVSIVSSNRSVPFPVALRMRPWWFNAAADGVTLQLNTAVPVPGLGVVGVPSSTVTATQITDASTIGRSLLTAPDQAAVQTIVGAGSVDEYHEYANQAAFPATGVTDRLYLAQDTGKLYRWNGSAYAQIADKASVGLGNVDNTADTAKPVSTAQQTALDLKAPLASPAFTGTPTGITKTHVGLGNVDNVKSDITLPSSVTTRSRPNAYRPDRNAYNFKGSNTRKLRASLAKAAQGSVQHWVVIGDSIPAGYMGDGASPIIDATKAWPRIMRSHIAAQGIPVGGTGFVPTSDTQVAFDSRWSVTGTWSVNTSGYMSTVQNGATATFVSDTAGTQVDVYYYGTGGAFTVNIDGLGAVTPTAGATLIPMKYTVTGLANTTHTVVITASNTTARYITGASVTGASGLVVSNLALSGSTSAQWADSTTVGFPNNARVGALAVSSITPDVVFLELGGNDHLQSVSSAAFKASMTTLRTQFSSSDVILVAIPSWTYMLDDHYDLADSLDVPLIDWFDRYGGGGSGQPLNNNGLITDTLNIHPNQAWHLDAGRNIGSLVTS